MLLPLLPYNISLCYYFSLTTFSLSFSLSLSSLGFGSLGCLCVQFLLLLAFSFSFFIYLPSSLSFFFFLFHIFSFLHTYSCIYSLTRLRTWFGFSLLYTLFSISARARGTYARALKRVKRSARRALLFSRRAARSSAAAHHHIKRLCCFRRTRNAWRDGAAAALAMAARAARIKSIAHGACGLHGAYRLILSSPYHKQHILAFNILLARISTLARASPLSRVASHGFRA